MTKHVVAQIIAAALLLFVSPVLAPPAHAKPPILEIIEGKREIERERRKMRHAIINSGSRTEAERALRNGMRSIHQEKREMRREVRQSVRRRYIGRVVAGIVLGEVTRVRTVGRPPARPRSDLCWFWSNNRRDAGYWYYCSGD
jgi:hypothetical protein